jgi:hypothetical protein
MEHSQRQSQVPDREATAFFFIPIAQYKKAKKIIPQILTAPDLLGLKLII